MKFICTLAVIILLSIDLAFASSKSIILKHVGNNCVKPAIAIIDRLDATEDAALISRVHLLAGRYKTALAHVKIAIAGSPNDASLRGLAIAIATASGDLDLRDKWVAELQVLQPNASWVLIEKLRATKNPNVVSIYNLCKKIRDPSSSILECAKILDRLSGNYKPIASRAISRATQESKDSFRFLIIARALELLDKKESAILQLEKVTPKMESYQSALRELVRLNLSIGHYTQAKHYLETLLINFPDDSINQIIAFRFYKQLNAPFEAFFHFNQARKCMPDDWPEFEAPIGYLSETVGIPISNTDFFHFSIKSYYSIYQVRELIQNYAKNLPLNLYYFRNLSVEFSYLKKISKNIAIGSQVGVTEKEGKIQEREYKIAASLIGTAKSRNSVLVNKTSISYFPIYSLRKNMFVRDTYTISNILSLHPDHQKSSSQVEIRYGYEKQINNIARNSFVESTFMHELRLNNNQKSLSFGLGIKKGFGDGNVLSNRLFMGFRSSLPRKFTLGTYTELFFIPTEKVVSSTNSISLVRPVFESSNLKSTISMARDHSFNRFSRLGLHISLITLWKLKAINIKSILETSRIHDFDPLDSIKSHINFKIGVPI